MPFFIPQLPEEMRITTLLITLLIAASCIEEQSKTKTPVNKIAIDNGDPLPISSMDFSELYLTNNEDEYAIQLNTDTIETKKFNRIDLTLVTKEMDFKSKLTDQDSYYVLRTFRFSGKLFKVIAYNSAGENDRKVLNVQLNSYDSTGQLLDKLLLDCRLTFEVEYYRDITINKDMTVDLVKYSIDQYTYDETGGIMDAKEIQDTIAEKCTYKIDRNGIFIKVN
ncbi:MAG: hypothetical protein V4604_10085 [Bacteroidota bacterium]